MSWISKLPISIPFPSLEKKPISFVPKRKVTVIKPQRFLSDSFSLTAEKETPKQGAPAINRAKKIIKNPLTFYKIK